MDEQDIELLKTLIDTQNITKTAKKLYTTQSSLTKRIQKMEQDLGCQLFIRSRKGILPTPAAEGIFPEIEKISQSMEHIRAYALSLQGEICGSLKIGVSVNIARYKLPAVLKTFMKKYPKVDIYVTTMQSTQLYRALADNEISIALVRGNFNWQDGDVILSREPVCLVRNQEMISLISDVIRTLLFTTALNSGNRKMGAPTAAPSFGSMIFPAAWKWWKMVLAGLFCRRSV